MHIPMEERQVYNCPVGFQFYTCFNNNFSGCCSVDPCDLDTCPSAPWSSTRSATPTTTWTTWTSSFTTTTHTTSTITSTSSSWSSSFSSSSSASSTLSPSSSARNTVTSSSTSTTSTASLSPTAIDNSNGFPPTITTAPSASHTSKAPIIAGIVSGVVAVFILALLFWFCWRRRRQKYSTPRLTLGPGIPKGTGSETSSYDPRLSDGGDVFAPFGGRFRTPRSSMFSRHSSVGSRSRPSTARPSTSRPSTAGVAQDAGQEVRQEATQDVRPNTSTLQVPVQKYGIARKSLRSEQQSTSVSELPDRAHPEHDERSTLLPESEKTDLAPPDLSQHPVYSSEATEHQPLYSSVPQSMQIDYSTILPNARYHPLRPRPRERVLVPVADDAEHPVVSVSKAEDEENDYDKEYAASKISRANTVSSTYTITVGLGPEDRSQNQSPIRSASIQRLMRPNLNPTIEEEGETQDGEKKQQLRKHVMSWAEYDDAESTQSPKNNNVENRKNNDVERWSGSTLTSEKGPTS
ncbi:hypothetical protein F5884DRAFT_41832 [Xylogone sp. PMI_703]|nr:hypothetical protein F5884DRAFT_41832 [Xylogone sp. PMI_703]